MQKTIENPEKQDVIIKGKTYEVQMKIITVPSFFGKKNTVCYFLKSESDEAVTLADARAIGKSNVADALGLKTLSHKEVGKMYAKVESHDALSNAFRSEETCFVFDSVSDSKKDFHVSLLTFGGGKFMSKNADPKDTASMAGLRSTIAIDIEIPVPTEVFMHDQINSDVIRGELDEKTAASLRALIRKQNERSGRMP